VPQSAPQPISCVPHYHPERRDFPDPVGSKGMSTCSLPKQNSFTAQLKRWRAYTACGLVCCTVRREDASQPNPESAFRVTGLIPTAFTQGPFAPRTLLRFRATTGPCADPKASRFPFRFCPMENVLPLAPSTAGPWDPPDFALPFCAGALRPLCRRFTKCT
jgi:hypothetical protein